MSGDNKKAGCLFSVSVFRGCIEQMYFMIDFENTGSSGLKGVEYLTEEDKLCIFFSQCCGKIEKGVLRQILESRCDVDGIKLVKNGKNALDFYIASKLGEVFGSGYDGRVAIVSKDKGFKAVQDYWKQSDRCRQNIVLNATIEQCIAAANEDNERTRKIQEDIKAVTLDQLLAEAGKRNRLYRQVQDKIRDSGREEDIAVIVDILETKESRREQYISCLRFFGRESGRRIYQKIKEIPMVSKSG